jgi:hypothetical protein
LLKIQSSFDPWKIRVNLCHLWCNLCALLCSYVVQPQPQPQPQKFWPNSKLRCRKFSFLSHYPSNSPKGENRAGPQFTTN